MIFWRRTFTILILLLLKIDLKLKLSCPNDTRQKMKFSIKDFLSKCDQIRSFLRIWSYLLKKSLMKNFIFLCSVRTAREIPHKTVHHHNYLKTSDILRVEHCDEVTNPIFNCSKLTM